MGSQLVSLSKMGRASRASVSFLPLAATASSTGRVVSSIELGLVILLCVVLSGCGSGGYIGGGIESLSRQSATIDATQSISNQAYVSTSLGVSWSLSGPYCGTNCGTLSNPNGATVTYNAPQSLAAPIQVQLVATVPGTSNSSMAAITVNPAPALVGTPPPATVGVAYSTALTTTGGSAPVAMSMTGGVLPDGLTFNAAMGMISGIPTRQGSFTATYTLTDASNVPHTVTAQETLVVSATTVSSLAVTGAVPSGTVGIAYSAALSASGGTAPYMWMITSGPLPPGLSLGASTGVIAGTPTTQGLYTLTVQAADANGVHGTAVFAINIASATSTLSLSAASLPNGTVGTPYSATIGVTGGASPYSCSILSGSLPAGLTLEAACLVSGTPTVPGTSTVTVKVTDSSNPTQTTIGKETLTINPTAATLVISSPPAATVGSPYSGSVGVTGGTAPYTCAVVSGTLSAGLTLAANCSISGTPTNAGTSTVMVKATDSSLPANTSSGPVIITVNPATMLVLTPPPPATVGTPYSGTVGVSGGTGPYTCTLSASTLPAGLTLGANCTITGTPTYPGSTTLTITGMDSANPPHSTTGPVTITVSPATLSLIAGMLPNGTVGSPYSSTIGVTGGTSPYTCTITSGTLPAGLTLGAACLVSGTPTTAGTTTVSVKATDSGKPAQTTTGPETITISPAAPPLVIVSPPAATVGVAYAGTVPVSGGTGPYTCSLISGTLPAGLALVANCVITGTPTAPGSSTVTVKATDSSSPANSNSGPVTVTVNPATTSLNITSPPAATVGTPYTGTIEVSGGTAPYNCTIPAGTLPPGLTLGVNCTITGTPTTPGSSSVTVSATDSGSPTHMGSGPVTVAVNPVPALTFTGSLPNATLGVVYTQTLHASGGVAPYTYALTSGSLPPGLTLSSTGVVSGTPTAVGASSFTVTATDSESTPQTASLPLVLLVVYPTTPADAELTGPYAFLFQGYDDVVAGLLANQTATAGSFTASGTGVISAGELDANHQSSAPAGTTVGTQMFLGTYTIGTDSRGSLTITTMNANGTVNQTTTYAISVHAPLAPATTSASGSMIEFDNNQLAGTRGSGTFLQQTASAITAGLTGSYAFGLSGDTPCLPACTAGLIGGPAASVGQFDTNGGVLSGGSDANIATTNLATLGLSGSYAAPDANGRVQLSMVTSGTPAGVYPADFAVYIVSPTYAYIVSTDKHSAYILLAGSAQAQTSSTYTGASLNGPYVGYENSPTNPGLVGVTLQNVLSLSTTTIFRGTSIKAGSCETTNVDVAGTAGLINGLTGLGSGSNVLNAMLGTYESTGNSVCTVASNGRVVFNYPAPSGLLVTTLGLLGLNDAPPPPRIIYLASQNRGYFLETGYAGLGYLEQQVGTPFSVATLSGTYVYGTTPAASLASINASGIFTANGAGQATTTLDENVGAGNINVLQLAKTATYNYTLTDATAGRFLLSPSTVIYAITPTRFVLVDVSALTTSPSVALIY